MVSFLAHIRLSNLIAYNVSTYSEFVYFVLGSVDVLSTNPYTSKQYRLCQYFLDVYWTRIVVFKFPALLAISYVQVHLSCPDVAMAEVFF